MTSKRSRRLVIALQKGQLEPRRWARMDSAEATTLDDLVGWLVMTAAVVPAVLTLLLAWTGSNRRDSIAGFCR